MKLLSDFQFRLGNRFKKNPFAVSPSKRTFNDLGGNSPRHSRKNLLTVAAAGVAAATALFAPQAAHAITLVNATVVEDTPTSLIINWLGANIDNGQYDVQFQNPSLVNWAIGDIIENVPLPITGIRFWTFTFDSVRHVTNPPSRRDRCTIYFECFYF